MLILLDMDGVLADFESGFFEAWRRAMPYEPGIAPPNRRMFSVRDEYPEHLRDAVSQIYSAPGFFRSLEPIAGAVEGVHALVALGHDVRICTAPLRRYQHCVPEKYAWVEAHLGEPLTTRLILTRDKTLVHGDVLVDDNPAIEGVCPPSWRHVVYDQPYNRHVAGPRMTWETWQDVLMNP